MTLNGRTFTPASAAPTAQRVMDARAPLVLTGRDERPANGAPVAAQPQKSPYLDRIVVRSRSRILFLDVSEVTWLEAFGNYVRFHTPTDDVVREGAGSDALCPHSPVDDRESRRDSGTALAPHG